MLTNGFVTLSGNIFHFLCLLKTSPFDWNFSTNRIEITQKSIKHSLWTKLLSATMGIFFVFRTVESKQRKDTNNFLIAYIALLGFILYVIITSVIVMYTKEICTLFNATKDFVVKLQSKWHKCTTFLSNFDRIYSC